MVPPLVIFDCDGVLVDSEPIAARVFSEALRDLGLFLDPEEVDQRFRGRSLADCLRQVEDLLQKPIPDGFLPNLNEKTFAAFQADLRAVDGVQDVILGLLDQGSRICVASSGSHEKIRHSLGLTGLLDFFGDNLFSASDVERGKPAPDLFEHAARRMGVPIQDAVVIEDSLPGVHAGIGAGARVFGFAASTHPEQEAHKHALSALGAEVFSSMNEAAALLHLR